MAKIVNEKYSMENIVRSSSQEVQMKVGKIYLHLKYFLFVGNLVSALLKAPEFYKMVSLVFALLNAKQNQTEEEKADEQPRSLEMMLNIAFLYVGFLVVIINQVVVAVKIIKKKYRALITYLVLFGIYLVFLMTAFFANLHESTMPLACKFSPFEHPLDRVDRSFSDPNSVLFSTVAAFMVKVSLFGHRGIYMPR